MTVLICIAECLVILKLEKGDHLAEAFALRNITSDKAISFEAKIRRENS